MKKKNFIYNVHFLIIKDSDVRHENYPFSLKKDAEKFFKESVKDEKEDILKREKEFDEKWVIKKNNNIIRTLNRIGQIINQYTKIEERIEKLKYHGYYVQGYNLKTYTDVGNIEYNKSLGEYRINIGRGKHHSSNKVYCAVIPQKYYDYIEYDMYRKYASNIDRVTIRLEKLELN
jgi:hypothetical protein